MEKVLHEALAKPMPMPDTKPRPGRRAVRVQSKRVSQSEAPSSKGRSRDRSSGEDDDVSSRSRFVPLTPISELLNRPYVTAKEAQRLIPCGNSKLYELIGSGELEVRKLGRRTLISTASIKRLHGSLPRAAIDRSDRAA